MQNCCRKQKGQNGVWYVFFGEKESPNLGDSVICNVAEYELKSKGKFESIYINDISFLLRGKDRWLVLLRWISSKIGLNLFWLEQLIYSLILYCKIPYKSVICYVGGALFQDFFINQIAMVLFVARLKKCRFATISIGIGPISKENLAFLKKRISKVKEVDISMRDGINYYLCSIDSRVYWCPDLAILVKQSIGDFRRVPKKVGLGCIDIMYYNRNYPDRVICPTRYQQDMADLVKRLCQSGYEVELFCNGDLSDYRMAEEIFRLTGSCACTLCSRPLSGNDLIKIISSYSMVISSRLHSLIVSYSLGIPYIGLVWDDKVREFSISIGAETQICDMSKIGDIGFEQISELESFNYDEALRQKLHMLLDRRLSTLFIDKA